MRVNAIRIPCFDIDRSTAFYTKLLGREKAFGSAAEGYVGFTLDNVTLLIEPEEATEFEVGRYLGFSLEVPDVAEFYRSFKDSIQLSAPPEVQPWGGSMTSVTDLDGNTLSVVQVADDV